MRAAGEHILINRDQTLKASEGGIALIDNSSRHSCTGTVASVGAHVDQNVIAPGMRVAFSQFAGTEVSYKKKTLLLLHTNDVLATINT